MFQTGYGSGQPKTFFSNRIISHSAKSIQILPTFPHQLMRLYAYTLIGINKILVTTNRMRSNSL
jgi:hypothetical protein